MSIYGQCLTEQKYRKSVIRTANFRKPFDPNIIFFTFSSVFVYENIRNFINYANDVLLGSNGGSYMYITIRNKNNVNMAIVQRLII